MSRAFDLAYKSLREIDVNTTMSTSDWALIVNSDYTQLTHSKSKIVGYTSLNGFFIQIKKVITSNKKRKYIYAYWPLFDSLFHLYGTNSEAAENHLMEFDKKLQQFINNLKGTNTMILITSDHGFIDTYEDSVFWLDDHLELAECLTHPLCGDTRVIYCYVDPSYTDQFEKYVDNKLSDYCFLYKSSDLIKEGFFGLFQENQKLKDRIGDYTLIMKENYILRDRFLAQKKSFHIGNHGGVSMDEMAIPLAFVKV